MAKENLSNMENDFERRQKINMKYFSAAKNSTIEDPKRFILDHGREENNFDSVVKYVSILQSDTLLDGFVVEEECCDCVKPYLVNVKCGKESRENDLESNKYKVDHHLVQPRCGPELDQYGNKHKLLDLSWKFLPQDKYTLRDQYSKCCAGKGDFLDHKFYSLLKPYEDFDPERYECVPKGTYCLNRSRRKRDSENIDLYAKPSYVDVSVGTSAFKHEGEKLEYTKIAKVLEKQDIFPKQVKVEMEQNPNDKLDFKEEISKPLENENELGKTEQKPSPVGSQIEPKVAADQVDKERKKGPPTVQEINYYEGSLSIYGIQDEKGPSKYPVFKITKTVTFEKEGREKSTGNILGIDSWMQTDGECDNAETGRVPNKATTNPHTVSSEPLLECAKICYDCLKTLANSNFNNHKIELQNNVKPGVMMDKSTSVEKVRPNLQLSESDLMRFIGDLLLEVIPREMYNRILSKEQSPSENEEYEVLVRSYDKASSESCNLKNCKVLKQEKSSDWPRPDRAQGIKRPFVESDNPTLKKTFANVQNPKYDGDDNTYDYEIVLNGRKIFVKVNKSVENLLSGNIFRLPADQQSKKGKQNDPEFSKMAGNCKCFDNKPRDDAANSKEKKEFSNTYIEAERNQKTTGDDPGRNIKPVVTSPLYGSDGRKMNKPQTQTGNSKNLYWCSVEVPNKVPDADKILLKTCHFKHTGKNTARTKANDLDGLRYKSSPNNPPKEYTNKRAQELRKCKQTLTKLDNECLSLYWESHCDRVISRGTGVKEKYENFRSNASNRNFVHGTEKRVITPPNNVIDNTPPLCIIKISDNDKCERLNDTRYRDFTVASLASVKLNSNPFDRGGITCRKCIETLKSLGGNWTEDENYDSYRDNSKINFCSYYWNKLPTDKATESENQTSQANVNLTHECHSRGNCCFVDNYYQEERTSYPSSEWNSSHSSQFLDLDYSRVSGKPYGICFDISRVETYRENPNEYPKNQNQKNSILKCDFVGVKSNVTTEPVTQLSKEQTSTQAERENKENKVEKRMSFISLPIFEDSSKSNLKKDQFWSEMDKTTVPNLTSRIFCNFDNSKSSCLEKIESSDKILVDTSKTYVKSVEGFDQAKTIKNSASRSKFDFIKAWRWWRRKDNINGK